ncbi:unnamed protein product [Linum trigynum]|uniref:Uncharacterized protein n=1 Tax=Linum trigynum TaxID=586398 RepID=A0AAV2EVN2_9ROSI
MISSNRTEIEVLFLPATVEKPPPGRSPLFSPPPSFSLPARSHCRKDFGPVSSTMRFRSVSPPRHDLKPNGG